MTSRWELKPLGELCLLINRGVAPAYVEQGGILVINQKCIRNHHVALAEAKRTDPKAKRVPEDRLLRPFDVLVNSTGVGTLGRVAQVKKLPEPATVDSHVTIVRPDPEKIYPRYLGFVLEFKQPEIEALAEGSTGQIVLPRARLRELEVPVPPLPVQRAIAHILGTLDDKIELLRRMNETLEAMARALFKSWFVDFDPVIDNALEVGNPIPDELQEKAERRLALGDKRKPLPEHIRRLFPARFVDSELGPIPDGWRVGTVGEEFDVTMGQSPPGSTYNESGVGLPFYQGRRDFGFRFPSPRIYCSAPTRIANPGDTLVTVRAPVGAINMAIEKCCIGRGVAAIRHKTRARSYTYYAMHNLVEQFRQYEAEGTVFGSITKSDFEALKILVPNPAVVQVFEKIVSPLDQTIESLARQISTLAGLRDTLLPKLISGKIRLDKLINAKEVSE